MRFAWQRNFLGSSMEGFTFVKKLITCLWVRKVCTFINQWLFSSFGIVPKNQSLIRQRRRTSLPFLYLLSSSTRYTKPFYLSQRDSSTQDSNTGEWRVVQYYLLSSTLIWISLLKFHLFWYHRFGFFSNLTRNVDFYVELLDWNFNFVNLLSAITGRELKWRISPIYSVIGFLCPHAADPRLNKMYCARIVAPVARAAVSTFFFPSIYQTFVSKMWILK